MSKVFSMLADLQAKLLKEGEEAQKVYEDFSEWCQERSRNIEEEIKTGKAEVADLSAAIEKESSKIAAFNTKIEELSGTIASDESDLKAATEIRTTEATDFAAEEKETVEVVGALQRSISLLNREIAKGTPAMLQLKGMQDITQAMDAMVQASVINSADASRLTALVQSADTESDGASLGAPDPAAYKHPSASIVTTLEDLLDKAEAQLETARKTEATNARNYQMLKQSLTDEISAGDKDMAETKKNLAASEEAKAVAEGDFSTTDADLKEDITTSSALHQDCTTGAEDFQTETKSRGEELKALTEAKKVLSEALPAAAQTYGAALDQATFLQISRSELASHTDLVHFEAIRFIRDLARKQNSVELAQLASRMSSVLRYGSTAGTNPLIKVKGLISDMIAKLEKDAMADMSHKGFCDKETSETKLKKDEKSFQINKLTTKVDSMDAQAAKLKEEIATIQKELGQLLSSQAEMDKIRSEEKSLYAKNKSEMQAGVGGVQKALSVLRDYYLQGDGGDKGGAGNNIIGLLEVVESDFTKGLSEMEVAESTAVKEYEKTTYRNKSAKTIKDKDLSNKAKQAAALDKSAAESGSDKDGVQAEFDALLEYLGKLGQMCNGKAEPYAERKARSDAEIAGLKQALAALEGQAVLLQESDKKQHSIKRNFRGQQIRTGV